MARPTSLHNFKNSIDVSNQSMGKFGTILLSCTESAIISSK